MGVTGWLIRTRLRSRRAALGLLALAAAFGVTATLVGVGIAERTRTAYAAYLDRANVSDVVINPSLVSRDIDRVARGLPGVTAITSNTLFDATADDGKPRTKSALDADPTALQVLGSVDGRFSTMDRPALVAGRLPTGRHEALVNVEQAAASHVRVGDVVPIAFWSRFDDLVNGPDDVSHPIAVEHVTVVGIATLSDEVLPDGVYPRRRIIVSPDVADRYDCLPAAPGRDATLQEAAVVFAPRGCATSYQYYAMRIRGGARGVTAALASFTRQSDVLTASLPKALRDNDVAYTLVAKTTRRDEQQRVERSIAPVTTALLVLGAAAAAITTATLGLMIARELARARREQHSWWQLGLDTAPRTAAVVVPVLVALGIALAASLLLAWLISPIAPVGTVRSVDPSPAREITRSVRLSTLGLAIVFGALSVALAFRSARRATASPAPARTAAVQRLVRVSRRPEIDEGLRAAYSTNRGAGLIIVLGSTAVAVFLAAAVFGASLSKLTSTPASYGWPWDVGVMGDLGYGGLAPKSIHDTLVHSADVRSWTELGFSNAVNLDGDAVPAVFSFDRASAVHLTIVAGTLPTSADQIALGARTAAERGLSIGDAVTVSGLEVGSHRATVAGIVVLPALGPLQADRVAPGRGVLVPQAMLTKAVVNDVVSFVGIELVPGADSHAVIAAGVASWDPRGDAVVPYASPVRPAEIINARSARIAPLIVGGLLVLAATIGLSVGIVLSVRARRRELAVLRALGFTGRQLRASVGVQALAMVFGGLVIGTPLGIVSGRVAWRAFASQLGVVTTPSVPVAWIIATGGAAVLVALLAAAGPARGAARAEAAAPLRAE